MKKMETKTVISQIYKSRDIITIGMIRSVRLKNPELLEDYCIKITKLVNGIARTHGTLEEIPLSKYVEPILHLNDIYYYVNSNKNLFPLKSDQVVIDKILNLIQNTKTNLQYEEN